MDKINWPDVAEKIRAKKFDEIDDDTWSQIADRLPKKRGRPPRPIPEYREDWSLEDIHKTDKRDIAIVLKYERLLSNKVKSKKAIKLISGGLDADGKKDEKGPDRMSPENVERIVYAWINMEKELKELMQEEE
jgi:hypothetical protein